MAQSNYIYLDESDPEILHAAFHSKLDVLHQLLQLPDREALLNTTNWMGCGPLRLAVTAGHLSACEHLVQCGADLEQCCIKAQTPLMAAIKHNRFNCAEGAKPDGNPRHATTPLYHAILEGNVPAVKLLIKHGANIHASHPLSGSYASPLLYSCIVYHQLSCFSLLIKAGADPDYFARDVHRRNSKNCQSLYFLAIKHDCEVCYAELLYHAGASLYYRDDKDRLPSDVPSNNQSAAFIKTLYDHPRALSSFCRLVIRESLGQSRLEELASLPLPPSLITYLKIDCIDIETVEQDEGRFYRDWDRRYHGPQPRWH